MARQEQIRRSDNAAAEYRRVQAELDAYSAEQRAWRRGDRERAERLARRSFRAAGIVSRLDGTEV